MLDTEHGPEGDEGLPGEAPDDHGLPSGQPEIEHQLADDASVTYDSTSDDQITIDARLLDEEEAGLVAADPDDQGSKADSAPGPEPFWDKPATVVAGGTPDNRGTIGDSEERPGRLSRSELSATSRAKLEQMEAAAPKVEYDEHDGQLRIAYPSVPGGSGYLNANLLPIGEQTVVRIHDVVVAEDVRGFGFGSRLTEAAITEARQRGAGAVDAWATNQTMLDTFRKVIGEAALEFCDDDADSPEVEHTGYQGRRDVLPMSYQAARASLDPERLRELERRAVAMGDEPEDVDFAIHVRAWL